MMSSVNSKFLKLRKWIPFDNVDWIKLSTNPNAIHILEKNLDKVDCQ
jgi:hypothetical protein